MLLPDDNWDRRMFFSCGYGNVTCGVPGLFDVGFQEYRSNFWACGVCPASRPTTGSGCGNTVFECQYGADSCRCSTQWSCITPMCEANPLSNPASYGCNQQPGHYSCRYPAFDQTCVCGAILGRRCSCPATPPTNGSRCLGFVQGACKYAGDLNCTCLNTQWMCSVVPPPPPPDCPANQPTVGTACSGQLSCAYGTGFCSCDGATWSCG
jgi:hypothetical protein